MATLPSKTCVESLCGATNTFLGHRRFQDTIYQQIMTCTYRHLDEIVKAAARSDRKLLWRITLQAAESREAPRVRDNQHEKVRALVALEVLPYKRRYFYCV